MKGEGEAAATAMAKEPQEPILLAADDVVAAPPALIRADIETLPASIARANSRLRRASAARRTGW